MRSDSKLSVRGSSREDSEGQERPEPEPEDQALLEDRLEAARWLRQVGEICESVRTASDIRAERVQAIKKAIAEGTYKVSGRDVAAKMLAARRREPRL